MMPEISSDALRSHLTKILQSEIFARASHLQRFLEFVVTKTNLGQAGEIKEYVIAVDALGRDPGFDLGRSNIVRVQAAKLRTKLRNYYATEGRDDRLEIRLPLGSYVPVFVMKPDAPCRRLRCHRLILPALDIQTDVTRLFAMRIR